MKQIHTLPGGEVLQSTNGTSSTADPAILLLQKTETGFSGCAGSCNQFSANGPSHLITVPLHPPHAQQEQ